MKRFVFLFVPVVALALVLAACGGSPLECSEGPDGELTCIEQQPAAVVEPERAHGGSCPAGGGGVLGAQKPNLDGLGKKDDGNAFVRFLANHWCSTGLIKSALCSSFGGFTVAPSAPTTGNGDTGDTDAPGSTSDDGSDP